jgi:histone acetyltransferase (RNA polymerase elongator complex component)
MFRILCDPSSGSTGLCLTEIPHNGSQIFCRVLGGTFKGWSTKKKKLLAFIYKSLLLEHIL